MVIGLRFSPSPSISSVVSTGIASVVISKLIFAPFLFMSLKLDIFFGIASFVMVIS